MGNSSYIIELRNMIKRMGFIMACEIDENIDNAEKPPLEQYAKTLKAAQELLTREF